MCIDTFLFDPAVNDGANVAIYRIGLIEIVGQVISETDVFAGDGRQPAMQCMPLGPVYSDQSHALRFGQ